MYIFFYFASDILKDADPFQEEFLKPQFQFIRKTDLEKIIIKNGKESKTMSGRSEINKA